MPYFEELRRQIETISLWADMRHEQHAPVKPILKRLRKDLARALRKLEQARPRRKMREREPNDLEAIRALRPDGPRRLWRRFRARGLYHRLRGAWLGRAAGCTLGAPVESWSVNAMAALAAAHGAAFPPEDYWPAHPAPDELRYGVSRMRDYLRGNIRHVPADDDLAYTLLGLLILETYGPDFTTEDVAAAWLHLLPEACTAEAVTLENLRAGVPPSLAGERNNPYQEWIGADIRSDPWGYAAPGWPEKAAQMAYRDAILSHRAGGVYGAMFFAAAIAAAFAVDCPMEALRIGLTEIPEECRLAADLRWALDLAPSLKDWREARAAVDERFPNMHPVHTNNNTCRWISRGPSAPPWQWDWTTTAPPPRRGLSSARCWVPSGFQGIGGSRFGILRAPTSSGMKPSATRMWSGGFSPPPAAYGSPPMRRRRSRVVLLPPMGQVHCRPYLPKQTVPARLKEGYNFQFNLVYGICLASP